MNEISSKLQFFIDLTVNQLKIKRKFDARLGINGVGLDDFIILYMLNKARDGVLERSELAKQIGISITELTRKLPKLEKIGLIKREDNPNDVKESTIELTRSGKKVYGYATESGEEKASEIFHDRSNNDLNELIEAFNSIKNLQK